MRLSPEGERLVDRVSNGHWKKITFVTALRHTQWRRLSSLKAPTCGCSCLSDSARKPLRPRPPSRGLQLEFTVEDDGVFTKPWSATIAIDARWASGLKWSAPKMPMDIFPESAPLCRPLTSRIS